MFNPDLTSRIGIHVGPCIAVETNEQLDYFGQTVNIAARLKGVAQEGEIVCTEAVYHAPEVAAVIQQVGLKAKPDEALLKGVGNPVTFCRFF